MFQEASDCHSLFRIAISDEDFFRGFDVQKLIAEQKISRGATFLMRRDFNGRAR